MQIETVHLRSAGQDAETRDLRHMWQEIGEVEVVHETRVAHIVLSVRLTDSPDVESSTIKRQGAVTSMYTHEFLL